jgi:hypothetical protein
MTTRYFWLIPLAGAVSASALRAQAPSQRELNGFLLGQHKEPIAASFTKVLRVDSTSDRWIYRTYLLDRSHHAYMTFKFAPDHPDQAVSLQIAGDSGTTMHPFAGLVLGDHREAAISRLGNPSRIEHEAELNLILYVYEGRNYSLEFDSLSRVSSIQVFGYDGFLDRPAETAPSLDSLGSGLAAGGDAALQYLAPDLEIYEGGQTHSFRRAAFTEVQDDTTAIAKLLFLGVRSVAAVLRDRSNRSGADLNIRVWERRPSGWVFKLPATAPIAEIVYVNHAGRWRVWEIRYR